MPSFRSKFFRRGKSSSSQDSASSATDYHRYDEEAENDCEQQTAVNGALHTSNKGNNDTITSTHTHVSVNIESLTQQNDEQEAEKEIVETNATVHEVNQTPQKSNVTHESNANEKADDDSSAAWWNLLSNKGSFDTTSDAVSSPMKEPMGSSTASNYIEKEKMLRKKAFNRAVLGGSIRFDNTFSDESITSLSYRQYSTSSWGMGFPARQQDEVPIEWTQQDSSYGAAVSAFGWLPKRIRKLAEAVFVVFTVAILVYVVIKIGAEISQYHSSSSSGGGLDLDDDDHYIAHNNNNGGERDVGDERFRFI